MKKLITLSIFLLSMQSLYAQLDFLPKFIRKMYFNTDTSRRSSFVVLPVLSSSPETGLEFGGAALLSFYTDTVDHHTRVSNIFGYTTVTTRGQTKLSLNASYWTPQNKFHYSATLAYYDYPNYFYGIGNNTLLANQELVNEKRYKASFSGEELFGNDIYVGFVSGFTKYFYQYTENVSFIIKSSPDVQYRHGGPELYLGPSFTLDTRNNNTYTTKGLLINSYFYALQGIYSNHAYEGGFFNIEYSEFFALSKKFVLGTNIQEQSLMGGTAPFFLLPEMGNDAIMRGYYQGRYRDRNLIVGQTELRYRIGDRLGLAAFAGTGEVFHTGFSFPQLKPDYGGGVRYFFDIQKGLSFRLDYGVGEKPVGEPRESGFYIALGQSF
jgi:hypothetical protein